MRRTLTGVASLAILIGILSAGFLYYRDNTIEHLYAEAAGYPQFFRGSSESADAVRKLATYRGRRSTDLLLALAVQNNALAPEAQTEAIKALRERKSPEVANALASLLQLHEGLDTRQAAAAALDGLPCRGQCIASILHYLERIWHGDLNYEDTTIFPSGVADLKVAQGKDQQALYTTLHWILKREPSGTIANLVTVYGLGSSNPSPFALDLVARLQLHEACPLLLQSDREFAQLSPESHVLPRKQLQASIASLNCKR